MRPYYSIPVVTTPAGSYLLTDLTTAKDELSITDGSRDAFLTRGLAQISAEISNYCNRVFAVDGMTETFLQKTDANPALFSDQSSPPLQLSRFPITAVTSVTETLSDQTTQALVLDTDYKIDETRGWLLRRDDTSGLLRDWSAQQIVVVYSGGFTTIPDDIVQSALRLITQRFYARGRDPMLMARDQQARGSERFWVGPQQGQTGSIPPEIAAVLDNYRLSVTA